MKHVRVLSAAGVQFVAALARRARESGRRPVVLLGVALVLTLVLASCADSRSTSPADTLAPLHEDAGAGAGTGSLIPQPVLPTRIPVAPDSQRVDPRVPRFSDPANVSNPLFPVSRQASMAFVGHVDGKPFRTEVTLLPFTRVVDWGGQRIETLVSQYAAYLDGRLQEVAYDLYAQADDGSVWYFGEDVADLSNGAVVTKESTWLAGKDGQAQMIMPAHPKVGDVFRTENIPGIAFEQVTVKAVGQTLKGPLGPIQGGMIGEELYMDGGTEQKVFSPGYGEFYTGGGGGDVEALALAVPTDALSGPLPRELSTLALGAHGILGAAASGDWKAASSPVERMTSAWSAYRKGEAPRRIEPWMNRAQRVGEGRRGSG